MWLMPSSRRYGKRGDGVREGEILEKLQPIGRSRNAGARPALPQQFDRVFVRLDGLFVSEHVSVQLRLDADCAIK